MKKYFTPSLQVVLCGLLLCISLLVYKHMNVANTGDIGYKFDFQVYAGTAQNLLAGNDIYQTAFHYYNSTYNYYFTYPPFAAIFFVPLGLLSLDGGKQALTIVSILSMVASLWLVWGMLGYKNTADRLAKTFLISAILLWAEPVQRTLYFGQINLFLLFLVILGFALDKRHIVRGICIGLAVSIKLTPLIFVAYLFVTRRVQSAIAAIVTFAASIVIADLVIPNQSLQYWTSLLFDTSRIGNIAQSGSLNGTLVRVFGTTDTTYIYFLLACIAISGLYLARYAHKKGNDLYGILICGITGLLISPFSWSHHWVWLILFIPFLLQRALKTKSIRSWTILVLFLCVLDCFHWGLKLYILFNLIARQMNSTWFDLYRLIWSNLYVVVGLLFLIVSTFLLYRHKKAHKM